MCCFFGPVTSVNTTQIFATMRQSSSGGASTQTLVYEASVATPQQNAMILPLPVILPEKAEKNPGLLGFFRSGGRQSAQSSPIGAEGIRLLDLSSAPELFKVLDELIPRPVSFGPPPPAAFSPTLAVHRVGSYDVSIVPTINDFERLSGMFRVDLGSGRSQNTAAGGSRPRGLLSMFAERYSDFSFVVCQLAPGKTDLHPFGVSFVTRYPVHLFYPTLQVHDGELHSHAHYDHRLYAQLARMQERGNAPSWTHEGEALARKLPFLYPTCPIERTILYGSYENRDIYVPVADPTPFS